MVLTAGGGGGRYRNNPYAGPKELELRQSISAIRSDIWQASSSWATGAKLLEDLARDLDTQGTAISEAYEGAGAVAATSYSTIATGVRARASEMRRVERALDESYEAMETAVSNYYALPSVSAPATGDPTLGMPNKSEQDKLRRERAVSAAAATNKQHETDYQAAENQASIALVTLKRSFTKSETEISDVAGIEKPDYNVKDPNSVPVGSRIQRPTSGSTEHAGVLRPTDDNGTKTNTTTTTTTPITTTTTPTNQTNHTPYVPPGLHPETNTNGELAGGTHSVNTSNLPGAGSTGSASTTATTSGSGTAAGVGAAAIGGAGALGAGTLGAMRGGTPVARAPIPGAPGAGRIGGTSTSTARGGALGRPGIPGQQGAAGNRTGGAGRTAGGRGGAAGAGSSTRAGAAGSRAAGAGAGGRATAAGGRGTTAAGSSTTRGTAAGNAASRNQTAATRAQGGSASGNRGGTGAHVGGKNGGKGDDKRGKNQHEEYDVDGGWLDGEEPTSGSVIQ